MLHLLQELIFLVAAYLGHRAYVSLMQVSRKYFVFLMSERMLAPRASRENLHIDVYQRGLFYLLEHKLVNYNKEIVPQNTYFRFHEGYFSVDIFDRSWVTRNNVTRLMRWNKRDFPWGLSIKKIFDYDCPIKDPKGWFRSEAGGYLIFTHDGTIVSYYPVSNHERERGDVFLIVKDVQAIDLNAPHLFFTYETAQGDYYMSDVHEDDLLKVSIKDVRSIDGGFDTHYGQANIDGYLDYRGDLYYHNKLIASSVKQVLFDYRYLCYLHYDGTLIFKEKKPLIIGINVKLFCSCGGSLYMVTYNHELHRFTNNHSTKIATLAGSVMRLEMLDNDRWLVEYE